ncbi:MAG: type toxin-antitoxin system prevent-host-death family antitoxin [Geminicoccaceae bacterium]|jgi:prevent-host-death family protein|nr:type toxin-antitoxin system prevent-host-death family antitoxin [Geminicoccaceae bacterium]MDF2782567.1 type toxin-antitoxin system prevent-host-death family antitoxin [Geminicoccaceae bacterium]
MRTVSAREANQQFARILGQASAGEEIVITRRGKPVAVLAPYRRQTLMPEQKAAIARAVEMMRRGLVHDGRRFTRDEMHER